MELSLEKIKKDIKTKSYSEVPFAMKKSELVSAAESFLDFLTLPSETKEKYKTYADPLNMRAGEIGYFRRMQKSGSADDKEFFHYHEYTKEAFTDLLEDADHKTKIFIDNADKVFNASKKAMSQLLQTLEGDYPGIHDKFFKGKQHRRFFLRFLKYDSKKKGDFLAKGHYDKGTLTLAIAESAPGLRLGRNDRTLIEVEHKENTAFFMPAYNFSTVSSEEFFPTWHDVVQRGEDRVNNETSRWAIVFFTDAVDAETPTIEETHTQQ
ncbi:hypothetical protein CL654_01470 [bacterium]|nr:hypothetical protein [bacterium]|tara:strand:- start:17300 stop:18097 length:798 start_codon:yes stop_codon:yes gene_type:complete